VACLRSAHDTVERLPGVHVVVGSVLDAPLRRRPEAHDVTGDPGPRGQTGAWRSVFADDFDGARVDPRTWRLNRFGGDSVDAPFNPELEDACFSPQNVAVQDGAAVLSVRSGTWEVDGRVYRLSSGTISTEGTFEVELGDHVEARVRVPRGNGLWPAFWTVPPDRWPPEIDVFEFFDTAQESRPSVNHHPLSGGQSGPVPYGPPDVDHRDSWHVYGLHRAAGWLVPFLDGVAQPEAAVGGDDGLGQFIILNLSVCAGASPPPGSRMSIDWVRAWRPL
jgi:beta-glucanase (GH16 family)